MWWPGSTMPPLSPHLKNADARLYMRNDGASVTQGLAAAALRYARRKSAGRSTARLVPRALGTRPSRASTSSAKAAPPARATRTAPRPPPAASSPPPTSRTTPRGKTSFRTTRSSASALLYDAFAAYPRYHRRPRRYSQIPGHRAFGRTGLHCRRRPPRHLVAQPQPAAERPHPLARRFAGTEEAAIWNWGLPSARRRPGGRGRRIGVRPALLFAAPPPGKAQAPVVLRPQHGLRLYPLRLGFARRHVDFPSGPAPTSTPTSTSTRAPSPSSSAAISRRKPAITIRGSSPPTTSLTTCAR